MADTAELGIVQRRERRSADLFLRDMWYMAMPSRLLPRGRLVPRRLLDEPLIFGRDREGHPFAMHNVCRHQAMPLEHGRFDGARIECPNHGWLFDTSGQCVSIPCLTEEESNKCARVRITSYPCRDVQGNIWIYMGAPDENMPEPPRLPDVEAKHLRLDGEMTFPCGMDRATLGLIDPAHGPYVHSNWFWRSPRTRKLKEKVFGPIPNGWVMKRHAPGSNSRALRLLPKPLDIEVTFQLPGLHFEHMRAGSNVVAGMITATPMTANETQINFNLYWTFKGLTPFTPLIGLFFHHFFSQDRRAMAGLARVPLESPPLTLVGDPDAQAVWYFKLKSEFMESRRENRPIVNPIAEDTVLRWRT